MRHVFINELIKKSKKDKDIYLITADLGFKAFEIFQKEFPQRFINLGVAENNTLIGQNRHEWQNRHHANNINCCH